MSRAEKFIEEHTRNCSNEMESPLYANPKLNFYPWLTPDQALRAVEIAREEMFDKGAQWQKKNVWHPNTEEPVEGKRILFYSVGAHRNWFYFGLWSDAKKVIILDEGYGVGLNLIKGWLYLDDLVPKELED